MSDNQDNNGIRRLIDAGRRYIMLNLDYARLTAAEKMTVLLSAIAFYTMVVAFGTLVLIFLSIGVGHLLAVTIAPVTAYLFVAAFYMVLLFVLIALRRKIFIDPICRFITKLFVKPPEKTDLS